MKSLYEADFVEWAGHNAELLRSGRYGDADIEHIAEEIEDLGSEKRLALLSHLRNLIAHLLKWQFQPGKRSKSWQRTIANSRAGIDDLVEESPSLRTFLQEAATRACPKAVRLTAVDTGLDKSVFPEACPYSLEDLLDDDFLPAGGQGGPAIS